MVVVSTMLNSIDGVEGASRALRLAAPSLFGMGRRRCPSVTSGHLPRYCLHLGPPPGYRASSHIAALPPSPAIELVSLLPTQGSTEASPTKTPAAHDDRLSPTADSAGSEGAAYSRQTAGHTDRARVAEARSVNVCQEPRCPEALRPGYRAGHSSQRDTRSKASRAEQGYVTLSLTRYSGELLTCLRS